MDRPSPDRSWSVLGRRLVRPLTKILPVARGGLLRFSPEENVEIIGIVEPQPVSDLFNRKGGGSKKIFCFEQDAVVDGFLGG